MVKRPSDGVHLVVCGAELESPLSIQFRCWKLGKQRHRSIVYIFTNATCTVLLIAYLFVLAQSLQEHFPNIKYDVSECRTEWRQQEKLGL